MEQPKSHDQRTDDRGHPESTCLVHWGTRKCNISCRYVCARHRRRRHEDGLLSRRCRREILGEGRGGGANLQAHGELEVEKVLHAVIEEAIGDRAILPAAVCLGVAGVDRQDDDRVVRAIMRRLGFRSQSLVVNDALVALVAGVGDEPGVVLIAGTGSIAYGVNEDGYAARAGGWGYVLGDEGSGYWIGRQALIAVVREADGRGPRTRLTALVLEHFGLSQRRRPGARGLRSGAASTSHCRAWSGGRARPREGDVVAAEILRGASLELTRAAASVIERLQMRGKTFPHRARQAACFD